MTAETITSNDDDIAECDNNGRVSTRTGPGCDHQNQLDHLDTMLHDIIRRLSEVEPLVPLVPRALALLDPAAAMRRNWKRGKNAVQERETTPLPMGEASADRPPLGA